ncbi:hypothetical protein M0R04_11940 [Candidatus Dojkabacteria bacterium]|jgi:hypothetical protein|nr:hypothetical protein [Candidatus Dojkabacteria bacterium]
MKKYLLSLLFISLFLASLFAEDYGDASPNKAKQIKVSDFATYFDSASPATVQSALQQLSASYPVVTSTPYLKLDTSNDPLTGKLQSGTDGTGYGLTWYSNVAGTYWDIDNLGTWNLYGQGDFTWDGYDLLNLAGVNIITDSNITMSSVTSGSVLFAGTGGLISQDNTNLFWDNTGKALGVGINLPLSDVDIQKGTTVTAPVGTAAADALRVVHNTGINSVARAGMFLTYDTDNNANTAATASLNAFLYKDGAGANTGSTGYIAGRYGVRMTSAATGGNITNANVLYTELAGSSQYTGTITNARGLYMTAFDDGGGAITNAHHIVLNPQTIGSASNVAINLLGDSTALNVANLGAGIMFGAGGGTTGDAGMAWNGTDFVINPQLVSDGNVKLISQSTTNEYLFSLYNAAANTTGNRIKFFHSRGTLASPTATQSGDTLGGFCFYGYTNAEKEGAGIYALAKSTWTASSAESYLSFWNTANSSVVNTERGRWTSTGLSLGAFNAAQRLHSAYNDQWVMNMTTMGAPTCTPLTTGGSMDDGDYYYVIAAMDRFGGETIKGTESSVATITGGGGNGSVSLTWTNLAQAYKYKIFRTSVSGTYTSPALITTMATNGEINFIDTLNTPTSGAPLTTGNAYGIKLHSGTGAISQINSSYITVTPLLQITKASAYEVDIEKMSQLTLLNIGGAISGGNHSSSYDRFYGTRPGSADPTIYAGNKHQNITQASYPAPTGTPSITGGSMAAGDYYYTIVQHCWALGTFAEQYQQSVESAKITVASGTTGSVVLSWNANYAGNTKSFVIYRTQTSGTYTTPTLIAEVSSATFTYTDTLATPSAGVPDATTYSTYPRFATFLRTEGGNAAQITYVDCRGNYVLSTVDNIFKGKTNSYTLAIKSGVAPTTINADHAFLYAMDASAGNCRLAIASEGASSGDPMLIGKGYLMGSNAANGDLYLDGTNNATRTTSNVYVGSLGGLVTIGSAASSIEAVGTITKYNNIATEDYGVPAIVDGVHLTAQVADIGATNITNAGTAGNYRVSYYLQDTSADITAGTITLTFAFTDDAGATTVASTPLALTALGRTSGVFYIRLASGNLTYAITHTGLFGTSNYRLDINTERVD